jgi:pimeloyl-ACP methyl ester carboxylesterase
VRVEFLNRPDGATIAYERSAGASPGVVFLHGLMSDRGGTKAQALAAHCEAKNYGFIRFDMFGHGASSGRFEDGGISRWTEDALAVLDALTAGPQILVGSSMGGWVMLQAAKARAARIAGLIGIAASADFTKDLMWDQFSPEQRHTITSTGVLEVPSEYSEAPYRISRHLIEDGARNLVLGGPIAVRCPVRLLQGQRDTAVPWERALMIADRIAGDDVELLLIKDGDHRLSRPRDLARLTDTLDDLVAEARRTML